MLFGNILEKLQGWKIRGLSIGYVLLILVEKFVFDVPGFVVGDDWLTQILIGLGIYAGRDTLDTVTKPK